MEVSRMEEIWEADHATSPTVSFEVQGSKIGLPELDAKRIKAYLLTQKHGLITDEGDLGDPFDLEWWYDPGVEIYALSLVVDGVLEWVKMSKTPHRAIIQ
jgi:hypothetical protein